VGKSELRERRNRVPCKVQSMKPGTGWNIKRHGSIPNGKIGRKYKILWCCISLKIFFSFCTITYILAMNDQIRLYQYSLNLNEFLYFLLNIWQLKNITKNVTYNYYFILNCLVTQRWTIIFLVYECIGKMFYDFIIVSIYLYFYIIFMIYYDSKTHYNNTNKIICDLHLRLAQITLNSE